MGSIHELAEALDSACLQHFDGFEGAFVLSNHVPRATEKDVGKRRARGIEIGGRNIPK